MNNFRAKLIALCRSTSMYIFGRPRTELKIRMQKTKDIRIKMLLSLVRTFKASLTNLFFPVRKKLFQEL